MEHGSFFHNDMILFHVISEQLTVFEIRLGQCDICMVLYRKDFAITEFNNGTKGCHSVSIFIALDYILNFI